MEKIKLLLKAFYKIPLLIPTWNDTESAIAVYNSNISETTSEDLRKAIKKLYKVKYAYDFNLGRSSIQIALRSFGLRPNDEVILSTYSCKGVIEPIIREKLKPILVDMDDNFNISPKSIEENITNKTKVIIMSHLYGHPAQIDEILSIAKKHKLYVIDDAAQVVGLKYNNKMVGTFGDVGILSFGIGKSLSATGGGMLITNNKDIADIVNLNWLMSIEDKEDRVIPYWKEFYSRKYTAPFYLVINRFKKRKDWKIKKMSPIDCALILLQLNKLDNIIEERRKIAESYFKLLNNIRLILPNNDKGNIFTKYVVIIKSYQDEIQLSRYLRLHRIETETNYKPLHLYPEYSQYKRTSLSRAEVIYNKVLTIPNYKLTLCDRRYVSHTIKQFFMKDEQ